jgi:hypothetical protein
MLGRSRGAKFLYHPCNSDRKKSNEWCKRRIVRRIRKTQGSGGERAVCHGHDACDADGHERDGVIQVDQQVQKTGEGQSDREINIATIMPAASSSLQRRAPMLSRTWMRPRVRGETPCWTEDR